MTYSDENQVRISSIVPKTRYCKAECIIVWKLVYFPLVSFLANLTVSCPQMNKCCHLSIYLLFDPQFQVATTSCSCILNFFLFQLLLQLISTSSLDWTMAILLYSLLLLPRSFFLQPAIFVALRHFSKKIASIAFLIKILPVTFGGKGRVWRS